MASTDQPSSARSRLWMAKARGDLRAYGGTLFWCAVTVIVASLAVVALTSARSVLLREIAASFATAQLPDIAVTVDEVSPPILDAVRGIEGVRAVDSRRVFITRILAADGHWLPARVTVIRSLSAQKLGVVHVHQLPGLGGGTPVTDEATFLAIEQGGLPLLGAGAGALSPVSLRSASGHVVVLPSTHVVHDTAIAPSTQERMVYLTVSPNIAAALEFPATLDQVLVALNDRQSGAHANEYAEGVRQLLVKRGVNVLRAEVLAVSHPHAALMSAMLTVMAVLTGLVAVCAFALIANFVDAQMKRERRIIGILRTLGASVGQAAQPYLALHLTLHGFAVLVGSAIGLLACRWLVAFNEVSLNIDVANAWPGWLTLVWQLLGIGALVACAVLLPILRACAEPPRSAIAGDAARVIDAAVTGAVRLAVWLRQRGIGFASRRANGGLAASMAMRNLWRRPWRAVVLVAAFASGAALVLTTTSNYESLMRITDRSLADQGHDLEVLLTKSVPVRQLEQIGRDALDDPRAVVEAWRRAVVTINASSDVVAGASGAPVNQRSRVSLVSFPNESALFGFTIVAGRAAQLGANDELLITRKLLQQHPMLIIGSVHEFRFRERTKRMRIVGLVEQIATAAAYAPAASFDALTGLDDAAFALRIKLPPIAAEIRGGDVEDTLEANQRAAYVAASGTLERALIAHGVVPAQIISRAVVRDALDEHVKVVTEVIRWIALGLAVLGAIVLVATAAQNVVDRAREVAILRTMGATEPQIRKLFHIEGASVLVLSLLVACPLAWLLTTQLLKAAETRLLNVAVPLQVSVVGLLWLGAGVISVLLMLRAMVAHSLHRSVRQGLDQ